MPPIAAPIFIELLLVFSFFCQKCPKIHRHPSTNALYECEPPVHLFSMYSDPLNVQCSVPKRGCLCVHARLACLSNPVQIKRAIHQQSTISPACHTTQIIHHGVLMLPFNSLLLSWVKFLVRVNDCFVFSLLFFLSPYLHSLLSYPIYILLGLVRLPSLYY